MTIEQVKAEAKKRFDMDITDEQAQKWLEAHPTGEVQDGELDNVAGGGCTVPQLKCPRCGKFHPALSHIKDGELYGELCSECIKKEYQKIQPGDPKLMEKLRNQLRIQ